MNLYSVYIKALSEPFYVVAKDPTKAFNMVKSHLEYNDLYFENERKLISIHLLAELGQVLSTLLIEKEEENCET